MRDRSSQARGGRGGGGGGGGVARAASFAGLCLVAAVFLFPFFWMVSNALRSDREVFTVPPLLLPGTLEWGNFVQAWLYLPFGQFALNSLIVAAAVTAITLVVSSLSAYAFARLRFRFRGALFLLYLSTLMIPQAVIVIPLFLMVGFFGWTDSYQALILPVAFGSFGTFLLRQNFMGVPKELEEAALIDGASHFKVLLLVIVPLCRQALGLLALFTFIGQWNSFLWPLIVVNGPEHATLPLGLTLFQGQEGTQWNYMMAGATIAMVPGVVLTVLLHRTIFKGIAIGSGMGGR